MTQPTFVRLGLAVLALAAAAVGPSPVAAFDAKIVDQSVVRILVVGVKPNGERVCCLTGTGFVVAPDTVATNAHVVDDSELKKAGATSSIIVVPDGDLKNLKQGKVLWRSDELDLAVVNFAGLNRPVITLHAGTPLDYPPKGEKVYAVGFPGIADKLIREENQISLVSTVTQGVVGKIVVGVSAVEKFGTKSRPIVQHNAPFNPGNSGGPLLDDCNVVVGVNTIVPRVLVEVRRVEGGTVGVGDNPAGVFVSPHISNLIEAAKSAPELKGLTLRTTTAACETGAAGGAPVWLWPLIGVFGLVAVAALVLALRKGKTREIVRVVESYSGWIRRKGGQGAAATGHTGAPTGAAARRSGTAESGTALPTQRVPTGAPAAGAEPGAAPVAAGPKPHPAATGTWILAGVSPAGTPVRLVLTPEELAAASSNDPPGLVIGRSATMAQKMLDDASVSRRHARIYETTAGIAIEDLQSAYGTKVNGTALKPGEPVSLDIGDEVGFGAVTLRLSPG
jgi:hypothetical protein